MLEVSNIYKNFERPILNNVSFKVPTGEMLLVLGPSGSGKSTLLRCLNRLESISSGQISLNGQDISSIDPLDLRKRVGMVFQVPALLPGSVEDNISAGPALRNQSLSKTKCESLIKQVGLSIEILNRQANSLSIGEQQRVALAQVLANRPEIIMLDEPTSALDPTAALTIEKLIQRIHHELKITTILVTHNIEQARRLNAQTIIMINGAILVRGPIEHLMKDHENDILKKFFKGNLNPNS